MEVNDKSQPLVDDNELEQLENELRGSLTPYLTHSPSLEDTQRLLLRLQPEFMTLKREESMPLLQPLPLRRVSLLKQCLEQARIYGKPFWILSALAIAMLTLLNGGTANPFFGFAHLFTVVLPIFLLALVVYSFRTWNAEMRAVESVTPFPPALLLLSRLLVITTMIVLFGMLGTIFLAMQGSLFPAWSFLLSWLSVVMFLSGTLAFITFRKGVRVGLVTAVAVWAGIQGAAQLFGPQFLAIAEWIPWLQASLLAAGIVLLLAAYRIGLRHSWSWDKAGVQNGFRRTT